MTGGWNGRKPGARAASVSTRAQWRDLLSLAGQCAADADRGDDGDDARLRRASLANRINTATAALFEREAGAATADAAKAFIRVTRAFARRETAQALRHDMANMVSDGAAFLDLRLTQMATDDFNRAHAGRPEVWG